jgi:hypothetical protein
MLEYQPITSTQTKEDHKDMYPDETRKMVLRGEDGMNFWIYARHIKMTSDGMLQEAYELLLPKAPITELLPSTPLPQHELQEQDLRHLVQV